MLKWCFTDEAQADMRAIRTFTRQHWGTAQSNKYINEIRKKTELLAQTPYLGVERSADLGEGIRSILTGSHMIYYKFDMKTLTVLAILHQAMIPLEHLRSSLDEIRREA